MQIVHVGRTRLAGRPYGAAGGLVPAFSRKREGTHSAVGGSSYAIRPCVERAGREPRLQSFLTQGHLAQREQQVAQVDLVTLHAVEVACRSPWRSHPAAGGRTRAPLENPGLRWRCRFRPGLHCKSLSSSGSMKFEHLAGCRRVAVVHRMGSGRPPFCATAMSKSPFSPGIDAGP